MYFLMKSGKKGDILKLMDILFYFIFYPTINRFNNCFQTFDILQSALILMYSKIVSYRYINQRKNNLEG